MHPQLTAALSVRDSARAAHHEAAGVLERARTTATAAQAEATRLEAAERSWIERHSKRLAEWIAAGSKGAQPVLAADAKAQATVGSARAAASAAAQTLARFESAERDSRQTLAVAEAVVDQAVRAVLTTEGDREAEEILREEAALEARRNTLRGLRELVPPTVLVRRAAPMEGDWLHIPMHELRASTPAASPRDRLHTPISQIGTAEVDPAAVEHWQARRASLLSGEDAMPPASAPEERAA